MVDTRLHVLPVSNLHVRPEVSIPFSVFLLWLLDAYDSTYVIPFSFKVS